MIYHDTIYGRQAIDEPVLQALIDSAALNRLRGVLQHGISGLIGITSPLTRFDHSLGVMILVRHLGGDLREQIAALLHDASHTAFSHVIDYVFHDHDGQSYHDQQQEPFLAESDVPAVLARFGYDWRAFLDESQFPILEQPAPRLCADRLDYFLRDCGELGLAAPADIQFALDHLRLANGRIVTDDLHAARWLGRTFMAADDASWSNFREVGIYEVTACAIRRGLAIGALSEVDIWGTDRPAWAKLNESDDAELRRWLSFVTAETEFVWDEERPTFRVSTKLRTIDPDLLVNGQPVPLSQRDPAFAAEREAYLARKTGQWPMRIKI